MLYECVECGHKVAHDAPRCPSCGTQDAGHRAFNATPSGQAMQAQSAKRHAEDMAALDRDRNESVTRSKAQAAQDKARSNEAFVVMLVIWATIAVWGGVSGGFFGLILGIFAGFIVAGVVIAFTYP